MKTQRTPFTLAVTFGLWLGLIMGCSSLRHSSSSERAIAPIKISAEDLHKAYESSEAEADKLYQGKILIVTGTVGTTSTPETGMGNPAVILIDARQKPIINCFGFATDARDAIAKLKTGQQVAVKGKCMGKVVTDIPVLEDSVIQ